MTKKELNEWIEDFKANSKLSEDRKNDVIAAVISIESSSPEYGDDA